MEHRIQYKRLLRAVCGGLCLCLILSSCHLYGRCQGVREAVVRLHILANSDTQADQLLKYQVRDAVVEAAAGWLDEATTPEEARQAAAEALPRLIDTARKAVSEAGYAYPVEARLCRMYFPTRQYGSLTLPAGMYEAVRFTIGEGKGQNWWCVVYPPLCAGAAADRRGLGDVLTPAGQELVEGGSRFVLRFKAVEWVEHWLRFWS